MTSAGSPRRAHGALRDEVLAILLSAGQPATARQVVDTLTRNDGEEPALTTVLTVLDRLRRAGEVERTRAENGELLFSPVGHEPAAVADDMLAALLRSKDRSGALASFAGNLDSADLDVLRKHVSARGKGD